MKTISLKAVLSSFVILLSISVVQAGIKPLRIMSYNIRFDTEGDGLNTWALRADMVAETIGLYAPDIFGVQEAYARQIEGIRNVLPQYNAFGKGRDNGAGERSSLFYRTDLFDLLDQNTLWLSETPEISSKSWGAMFNRVVTWGCFRRKEDGLVFYVFNTHFDHKSANARKESAKLLLKFVHEIGGNHPCIMMGDFNSTPQSEPYAILCSGFRDSYSLSKSIPAGPAGTIMGFDGVANPGRCIDYIFVKNDIDVMRYAVLSDNWNGRSPSDHRPVLADLLPGVPPHQTQIDMSRDWRFYIDPDQTGIASNYHTESFNDDDWELVHAGLSWEEQGAKNYDGDAFYRKQVVIPDAWKQTDRIVFSAAGVDDTFALYINGKKMIQAGTGQDTFWNRRVSIQLPHDALHCGKTNTIVLLVTDRGGGGGLVGRPVTLTTEPRKPTTHVADAIRTKTVIEKQDFIIRGEPETTMRFDIPVVPDSKYPVRFRYGIGHSTDDTGDGGITYRIEDVRGHIVTNEFIRAKGVEWREITLSPGHQYQLILEDADTASTGKHPGNGGTVEGVLYIE
jgi:endonuclease/exonuclease/phosphatase family metal-dependent hydrolase